MPENYPEVSRQAGSYPVDRLLKLLDDLLADLDANRSDPAQTDRILSGLVNFVEADSGTLSLISLESGLLEQVNMTSGASGNASSELKLPPEILNQQVSQDRQARLVHNYPAWANAAGDGIQVNSPLCALAVPVLDGDQLEGVLALTSDRDPAFFKEADLELAGLFARLVGIAIRAEHRLQTIERLSTTDSLTGVWTRSQFLERSKQAFRQAVRYQRPLSAVLIDIDRFKMLNEVHGYLVGDQVLGTVARNIVSRMRDSDLLGRYGGEEFILLLPETDLEHARMAAERMRTQIAAAPTETSKGIFFVTISAGIASLESAAIDQLEQLLELAEQAMRAAKLAGRNQVAVYSDTIHHL